MDVRDEEPEGDELELITPEDFLPRNPFPADAQRMGIDRFSGGDSGFIALAAALDGRKPSHRIFATVLLILVVGSFSAGLWGQLHH